MRWISKPRLFLEQESSRFGRLFVLERTPQPTPAKQEDSQKARVKKKKKNCTLGKEVL
jgi:hypothetical protein